MTSRVVGNYVDQAGEAPPAELPTRLEPALERRVEERERQERAAIAAKPGSAKRPMGRPRKVRTGESLLADKLVWVKLQPMKVSGRQEQGCTFVRVHGDKLNNTPTLEAHTLGSAEGCCH